MAAKKKTTKKKTSAKTTSTKKKTSKAGVSKKKASSKKTTKKKTSAKTTSTKKKTTKAGASKKASTKKKTTKAGAAKKTASSKKTGASKKKTTKTRVSKKTTKASTSKKKAGSGSSKKTTKVGASKTAASKKKASSKKTTKVAASKKAATSKKKAASSAKAKKTAASEKTAASKVTKKAGGSKKAVAAKTPKAATTKQGESASPAEFSAFGPRLIEFLVELGMNNDKAWFTENKSQYEAAVREPARAFIRTMGPGIATISSEFVANDKKVGGSLMRVYRDVRFSKDKTPYKTNVGIHFRHKVGKDAHAPGLYVHIAPGRHFVGVGMWRPDKDALAAIRKRIVEDTDAWVSATQSAPFKERFELGGESLSRPPKGFDKEHPMLVDLKRKDHIAMATIDEGTMIGDGVVEYILSLFEAASPYMAFQCQALGISF